MINLIVWSIVVMGLLNAESFSEPPPIQLTIETSKPKGTLIGSIRKSYSSVQMQPPYYIVPIVPDNQDLFNKDISVDLDTGDVVSNGVLNSEKIRQYKFSALSINEGLATLVIINVMSRDESVKNTTAAAMTTTKENSDKKRKKTDQTAKCLDLNSNSIVKIDSVNNCFQINPEPIADQSEACQANQFNWLGVLLIKCNQESNADLVYLNRYLIETFQSRSMDHKDSNTSSEISEFLLRIDGDKSKLAINFLCSTNNVRHNLNLSLTSSINQSLANETKFVSIEQYETNQLKDAVLNSYLKRYNKSKAIIVANLRPWLTGLDNCSESIITRADLNDSNTNTVGDQISNSTVYVDVAILENSQTKVNSLNLSVKICLIVLSLSITVLLILLYGLFFWHKKFNPNSSTNDQHRMSYNSSSLANLAFKTQTSTMNSKLNETNDSESEIKQRSNYFSIVTSNLQQSDILDKETVPDLKPNTTRLYTPSHAENYNNLVDQTHQSKLMNSELFSYSNGYLAQIGINMMDNLKTIDHRAKYASNEIYQDSLTHSSTAVTTAQASANGFSFLLLQQQNQNGVNRNDECFQRWCSMLDWKPEFNEISCVLNDLLLLNDLPK